MKHVVSGRGRTGEHRMEEIQSSRSIERLESSGSVVTVPCHHCVPSNIITIFIVYYINYDIVIRSTKLLAPKSNIL